MIALAKIFALVTTFLYGMLICADIGAQRQLEAYVYYCESGKPDTRHITCDERRLTRVKGLLTEDE